MNVIIIFSSLILFLVFWGVLEYILHARKLRTIPIRIHVNGTRGKSSVTRLIAAGLRAGGIRTFAKTTGTLPRMITHDSSEFPVFRHSRANIIEQLRIVSFAASNQARALVIECMALQPFLQSLSELKFIKATHGVITNTREDHLDVMGPSETDVARALLGTTPHQAVLFTCEQDYPEEFNSTCIDRGTQLVTVPREKIEQLTDEEMSRFSYVEHRDNVALALMVCENIGVPRNVSLEGMQSVQPDVGAMNDLTISFFGKTIYFVNGFAANDPESSELVWQMARETHHESMRTIMVINSRFDRPDRSRQLGDAIPGWPLADKYILIGSGSYFLTRYAIKNGISPQSFVNAEGLSIEGIFEEILSYCTSKTLIVGIGNIAGPGLELLKYFKNRAIVPN